MSGTIQRLPSNMDAERFVLGSILLDGSRFTEIAATIDRPDFSLEKHRRIFAVMQDLNARGDVIDRITVANELLAREQLEACDGLGYLVSLDDGMPAIENLGGYIRIVKDKAVKRRLIYTAQNILNRTLADNEQAEELVARANADLLQLESQNQANDIMSAGEILESLPDGVNSLLSARREMGIKTGIVRFDEMTWGLAPGQLILLAGRPSMGKTSFALNIAQRAVTDGNATVIFSLEMSKMELLQRMACSRGRVDYQRFRSGSLDADERGRLSRAIYDLVDRPLWIDDSSPLSLMDIDSKLRRLRLGRPLGLVIIDYLQLLSTPARAENRVQEISALSRGLKLRAQEFRVPIIALSQLSRAPESRVDHRPQLSDLRDSGTLEQDADIVTFIFREEVYKPDREDLRGCAELILAKQRNGPTGRVNTAWLSSYMRFENRAADIEGDAQGSET